MRKIPQVTEAQLASVMIPNHGKRYAPITYTQIIGEVKRQAAANGIDIVDSVYRTTEGGKIATGQYFLNYGNDPDIKLMFAWTNSYNKMRRFSCGMGTYVSVCLNGMLTADYSKYSRKHIGSAKKGNTAYVEMVNQIEEQFKLAANVFAKMVQDKNSMIDRNLTNTEINELLGRLFMDDVVGSVQMNIVKQQLKAPAYTYSGEKNSLWHFYNHVTHALKEEHPISFDEAHYKLHEIITNDYLTSTVAAAPVNVEAVVIPEGDDNQLVEEFLPVDQEVDTILEQEETGSTFDSVFVEDSVQEVQQENKTDEDDDLDWLNF